MNRPTLVSLLFLCLTVTTSFADELKTDLQCVKGQLVDYLCQTYWMHDGREARKLKSDPANSSSSPAAPNAKAGNATQWFETLRPDGTWGDLKYADQTHGSWSAFSHLGRLFDMARFYASPESPLHGDPALGKAIHSALGHWLANDYRNPNWWYNQIGVPRSIASILLLIESELSPQEKADGVTIVARAQIGMTGQNRVWLAENVLIRALLEGDSALAQSARDVIVGEITVGTAEGVQPDNSFHQHGPQLQLGNYGLGYASDLAAYAQVLRGTSLAIEEPKMEILRRYLLEGERPVCWKGRMDISSCGRQLVPGSPASKCQVYISALEVMKVADPVSAVQYQAAIDSSLPSSTGSNALIANKHFWRSDYMVDRRSGYYASVKMNSHRVIGSEIVNGENLRGFHLGDGAMYLYRTGHEYEDIFPVWDWRKLPGVTAAQTTGTFPSPGIRNDSDFVGGVSDGHDGAAAIDYRRDGVAAKKSWFFFDGRIVCLGAGITSDRDATVTTSVNQCLQAGEMMMGPANASSAGVVVTGRRSYDALEWAWHDGIGYVFSTPAIATLGAAPQQGAWTDVYSAASTGSVKKEVFALWIDHGTKPKDAVYSYVVLPSMTAEQVQTYVKSPDVELLSNTVDLQAAKCGALAMAVFHQPGQFTYALGKQIAVDQPCMVMLREYPGGAKVTVSDPAQKLQAVGIVLNGKSTNIELPQGPDAGSSMALP